MFERPNPQIKEQFLQKGDLMLPDNILASHGREPFVGTRKILVAMSELYTL